MPSWLKYMNRIALREIEVNNTQKSLENDFIEARQAKSTYWYEIEHIWLRYFIKLIFNILSISIQSDGKWLIWLIRNIHS